MAPSLDPSFGTQGKVITNFGKKSFGASALGVKIREDSNIVVAGRTNPHSFEQSDFALASYHTDGRPDTTFGRNGRVIRDFGHKNDLISAVAFQTDGKIVAAGGTERFGEARLVAARYNPNGKRDRSFGTHGHATTPIPGESLIHAGGTALQKDGKIIVVGSIWAVTASEGGRYWLVRYNPDGSLDSTFGTNGIVQTDFGAKFSGAKANAVAVQQDSKIVLAGGLGPPHDSYHLAFVRYEANGSLDTSFGTNGIVTTAINISGSGEFNALAIQTDGNIIGAGFYASGMVLARYRTNGSLDASFGTNGVVRIRIDKYSVEETTAAVAVQRNGKILVVGTIIRSTGGVPGRPPIHDADFAIVRHNTNGTLDSTFGNDGKITTTFKRRRRSSEKANALTIQGDGKIVAVGSTSAKVSGSSSKTSFAMTRYNG